MRKGCGKSSERLLIIISPLFKLYITRVALGLNSAMTCLQAPHGGMGFSVSETTATISGFLQPLVIIEAIAALSAQIVSP
jgi:hypothetical protein